MKLIEKCKELYDYHSAGGSLHIVLDDENTEDSHIIFSLKEAIKERDWLQVEIAVELLEMTKKQRDKFVKRYSEYA